MRSKVVGIILILCFALSLIGCGREKGTITDLDTPESGKASSNQLKTIDDVKDKRIAVLLGSVHDTYVLEHFPEAEAKQYKSNSDIVLAVKSGKVDVGLLTYEAVRELMRDDHELAQLGDNLFTLPVGMGFNKGNEELREQFNQFLKEIKADGTHADMVQRWVEEGNQDMPVIDNSGKNGVLVVGVVSDKGLPFCVKQNNQWIGLDIEFVKRFGAYLGKKVEFLDMEFGSLIAAAAANKVDMIASTLVITEERQKQVDFSDPYYELGTVFFALKKNIAVDDTKMATLDDIDGKRLGVMTGTIHDKMIAEKYPSTKILRFDTTSDMVVAIKSRKIDAAMMATSSAKVVVDSNPDLGSLVDDYMPKPLGMGFNKNNPELRDRFNAFLQKIREDGTYDEIYRRWFVEDPEKAVIPPVESSSTGETLVVGVAVDDLPYVAYINGQYTGCDIEIVQRFAAHEGMRLEIVPMQFGSLIAALASGKVDMITDGIAITEERAQKIDFSDPYMELKNAVIGLK
ncbi:MAG: transporter substrate-binding domain-containing protein, partial [Bacillota bacterium]